MESTNIQAIRKAVQAYDDALQATDPRFRREAIIIHEDGSYLHFSNAFLMKHREYLLCFTEHHGTHIYHMEDLARYWEVESRFSDVEELP